MQDARYHLFADESPVIINGPRMRGANVIFAIVPIEQLVDGKGYSAILFRTGLEASHALTSKST